MKKYIKPAVEIEMIEEKVAIMAVSDISEDFYSSELELKVGEEADLDIWND